ncbi:MAG: FCD domain-containing protein, partial [Novosphingobium sp.]
MSVRFVPIVPTARAAALHWEFHNRLYARAGRARLLSQISQLQIAINRYVLPVWQSVGLSEDWDDSHLAILNAVRTGDVTSAAQMTA